MKIAGMKEANDVLDERTLHAIREIKAIALEGLKPSMDELEMIAQTTKKVARAMEDALSRNGVPVAFIEPQGSTGIKQTQLAGDSDVDLFIGLKRELIAHLSGEPKKTITRFNKETFTRYIHKILIPTARELEAREITFSYAEHPYLGLILDDITFDLVFCYELDSNYIYEKGIISSMDRTPLHSKFVKESLSNEQKDDVRLAKAFLKAHYIYGDKSACGRMGFVGYLLELLISYFGSIENLMVNFKMLEQHPIDYHGREEYEVSNYPRFSNDFLIITDPTDPRRNVGSSTDPRAFYHALAMIESFLKNPTTKFFKREPIPAPANDKPTYFATVFKNSNEIHYTIVRDKLFKLAAGVEKTLGTETTGETRFGPITTEVILGRDNSQAAIGFHVTHPHISKTFRRRGPPSNRDKKRVSHFLKKHPRALIDEDGFYYIEMERKFTMFEVAATHHVLENLKIKGVNVAEEGGGKVVEMNPELAIGRQSIHVLKTMVMPHIDKSRWKKKRAPVDPR
ncbi:MAG: hypothetical protein ACTSUE_00010 [Promethearchaeota archaeon]